MHQKEHYRSQTDLLVLMGEDFRFQDAEYYFQSSDDFISYYNEHQGKDHNVELIYSTPSMYVDALAKQDIAWPVKYDDMFPYADKSAQFWAGYFSARANAKEYIRRTSRAFHAHSEFSCASCR